MKLPQWFWVVLGLSVFLRLILIPNPGFEADISFWKSWGLATLDLGMTGGIKVTNFNYPTPFAYVLGLVVWIYSLFADPHTFNEFWSNTNTLFLFIAKLLPILADFGIAWLLLVIPGLTRNPRLVGGQASSSNTGSRLGGRDDKTQWLYPVLASVYLLNPIALIDGAWWGQVDSLGVFIFLLAFVTALKNKPFLAGVIFMVAMMTKLQNMIYGPLFFLFLYQTSGYNGLIRGVAGATLAFFGLNIEFLLAKNMTRVVGSLTENYDYFPWMSLNAFNLWWIVAGGKGMEVSDKLLAIGIADAKTVGLVLFSSFYLFSMLQQFFSSVIPGLTRNPRLVGGQASSSNTGSRLSGRNDNTIKAFFESLIIVNAAFFLFQTQSHDRYAFPLTVFLLLLAPFYIKQIKILSVFYLLYTVFYSYNLHTALVMNYPNNGIPGLSTLRHPFFTIATSIALLGLFIVFLVSIARNTKRIVIAVAVAMPITILFLGNLPLILKKPVSLTRLSPYINVQGYGQLTKNMPVNAFLGWREWHFLSVQYTFYRKGIGTHSHSRIDVDIGKKFKKFTTDVGIDTEAGPSGSAVFEIYGDNRLLYSSGLVKRFEFPRHADIDVSDVKFMTLITTDGGDGIMDDHTDWLNPTLWP
ncbi:hypothetical protein A2971_02245 [Candidatus Gottesmanbacteria bacterium RIFCSPLOWO2_01_FULL_46_21]|uniref:Glycosyl hydrolase family 98 putative carbohydrate-binding module domain-containing protein n=1 Tax=Candidatus Gottesmanbacteria bacterium RIFCSPLOWO2_01_FULL_46_21 TaxID=1798393 RepID=A0A1F6AXV6_9BACT|nr:MAG: hypothetical protein A2971_02245 [Candidatus Gottesmanbacteria bacterium RIFCSPLOWO2_01_FULL_46_21]